MALGIISTANTKIEGGSSNFAKKILNCQSSDDLYALVQGFGDIDFDAAGHLLWAFKGMPYKTKVGANFGRGIFLDGASYFCSKNALHFNAKQEFTAEFFFTPQSIGTVQRLFAMCGDNQLPRLVLRLNAQGNLEMIWRTTESSNITVTYSQAVTAGETYRLILIWDNYLTDTKYHGFCARLSGKGITKTETIFINVPSPPAADFYFIFGTGSEKSLTQLFTGTIDEFRLSDINRYKGKIFLYVANHGDALPELTAPFTFDNNTLALLHFD